jgi:hypothetical protein
MALELSDAFAPAHVPLPYLVILSIDQRDESLCEQTSESAKNLDSAKWPRSEEDSTRCTSEPANSVWPSACIWRDHTRVTGALSW